jgi:hypothetical protein
MDIEQRIGPDPIPDPNTGDEDAEIERVTRLCSQFLQADPVNRAYIDRTIRQHLDGGISFETWGRILTGLNRYAGEDIATLILMALLRADEAEFLASIEEHLEPEVRSYLWGLIALYSDDLREAYALFGENPQGWRTVNRKVYYEHLTEKWYATYEIIKFDGERIVLDETPSSAIVLCQAILDALISIPEDLAPETADQETIEGLTSMFYTFLQHYAPHLLEPEEEEEEQD